MKGRGNEERNAEKHTEDAREERRLKGKDEGWEVKVRTDKKKCRKKREK